METFCRIYENFLLNKKGLLPKSNGGAGGDNNEEMEDEDSGARAQQEGDKTSNSVTEYKLEDILKFVDQLYDLSAMTYN